MFGLEDPKGTWIGSRCCMLMDVKRVTTLASVSTMTIILDLLRFKGLSGCCIIMVRLQWAYLKAMGKNWDCMLNWSYKFM
ncbi:hypothetical protein C5167_049356, partial [Papaver somniferum]